MSDDPAAEPHGSDGGRLRGALLRFAVLASIIAALAALLLLTPAAEYLDREKLTELLGRLRQAWWAPLALIASYLVIAPSGIPVSPLIAAGGAVFGPLWGWVYNSIGCLLGAVVSYGLAHALGKELVEHLAGERRMRRVEAMLERHGFWTLVGIRFMPIPFALINYGASLAGFRFGRFLTTTTIGLVPSILMWTYIYYALVSAATADERSALLRNGGLVIAMIALLLLLRPLGRMLLKRDRAVDGDPDAS
jgi:uncharacterized membrane protein YdjX (TVP38/TMEM64 family)